MERDREQKNAGESVQRPRRQARLAWLVFASCVLSTLLFAHLASEWSDPGFGAIEARIALFFFNLRSPAMTVFFKLATWVGSTIPLTCWVLLLCCLPRPATTRRDKVALLLVSLFSTAANLLLKWWFARARPGESFHPLMHETSQSFPSGHSMLSLCIFGFSAYLATRAWPRRRWGLLVATSALILTVGASRIYLAVHFPADVAGAYAAGWPCLALGVALHRGAFCKRAV